MGRDATPALYLSSRRGPKPILFWLNGWDGGSKRDSEPESAVVVPGHRGGGSCREPGTQLEQLEIPQTETWAANPAPIAPGRVSLPLTARLPSTTRIRGCRSTRHLFPKEFVPKEIARKGGISAFLSSQTPQSRHQAGGHSLWLTLLSPLCSFECFIPARFILFQLGLFECFIPVVLLQSAGQKRDVSLPLSPLHLPHRDPAL